MTRRTTKSEIPEFLRKVEVCVCCVCWRGRLPSRRPATHAGPPMQRRPQGRRRALGSPTGATRRPPRTSTRGVAGGARQSSYTGTPEGVPPAWVTSPHGKAPRRCVRRPDTTGRAGELPHAVANSHTRQPNSVPAGPRARGSPHRGEGDPKKESLIKGLRFMFKMLGTS